MPYVSAHFIEYPNPDGTKTTDERVVAVDDQGTEWFIPHPYQECQVGDWLRFIEGGGTVRSYDEYLATKEGTPQVNPTAKKPPPRRAKK